VVLIADVPKSREQRKKKRESSGFAPRARGQQRASSGDKLANRQLLKAARRKLGRHKGGKKTNAGGFQKAFR